MTTRPIHRIGVETFGSIVRNPCLQLLNCRFDLAFQTAIRQSAGVSRRLDCRANSPFRRAFLLGHVTSSAKTSLKAIANFLGGLVLSTRPGVGACSHNSEGSAQVPAAHNGGSCVCSSIISGYPAKRDRTRRWSTPGRSRVRPAASIPFNGGNPTSAFPVRVFTARVSGASLVRLTLDLQMSVLDEQTLLDRSGTTTVAR